MLKPHMHNCVFFSVVVNLKTKVYKICLTSTFFYPYAKNAKNAFSTCLIADEHKLQSKSFAISVSNSSLPDSHEMVYIGQPNDGIFSYWITIGPPRLLQFIRIEHRSSSVDVMTICEVLAYDTSNHIPVYKYMSYWSKVYCVRLVHVNIF